MIWFTIAMFAVSFLATAILTPKPEFEDARAGSLDDVSFPMASEDAPIALILGKVRLNAPNTLWYGNYETYKITKKQKTGLFSSTTVTLGHKYYLGLVLGLGLGPNVQMTDVWIDETNVWEGETSETEPTKGAISAPELFGGYKNGGGWVSKFTFYPGSFDQPTDPYLVTQIGDTPAYRGLSYISLHGGSYDTSDITNDFGSILNLALTGTFGSLANTISGLFGQNAAEKAGTGAYIGESNQLRQIAFTLQKYTNALGAPNSGKIGDDMNPMEALYQVMTDDWAGMGVSTSVIGFDSWFAAAQTLYDEGNGVSVIVTSSAQGKTVIQEILRQIDAIMYQDPETGTLEIKLIRSDYDTDDLDIYDESDVIAIRSFTKTSWEDVIAQTKVSFPQRDSDSSAVAVAQDMATAGMIGNLRTTTLSFPFCYDRDTANSLAARELAQLSVPLFKMTLSMNRAGYSLRPGDVFILNWDEYNLSNLVMRVQKHDLGALLDNKVVIDCVQDSFAISETVFAAPTVSTWVAPVTVPTEVATWTIEGLPAFFARKIDEPVAEGNALPMILPAAPSSSSSNWSAPGGVVSELPDYDDPVDVDYPATATLSAAYARDAGQTTGIDAGGFTVTNLLGEDFVAGTEAQIYRGEAGLLYVDGEWMGFTDTVYSSTAVTFLNVHRGLFGSTVKDHAISTRVYQPLVDHFPAGDAAVDISPGDTWYYKILDAVGGVKKDPATLLEQSWVADDVMQRPMRARGLTIDATRDFDLIAKVDSILDGNATNRETGTSFATELAASETPPESTSYNVEVYVDGALQSDLGALNTTLPYTIPFLASSLTGPLTTNDAEVRVFARRQDPVDPGVAADVVSPEYASLTFSINLP